MTSGQNESAGGRPVPSVPDHQLLRLIGRGSYGEVWLARNIMGALRAVKLIYRGSFDDSRPYEREYAGLKRFEPISRQHPSQIDILHMGRDDNEACFYYVMELADSSDTPVDSDDDFSNYRPKTLRCEMERRGPLPPSECIELGLALSTALAHLHQNGLVHRDIKPSNIIFVNGLPKLADIGLVSPLDATRSYVGTIGYAPYEGPGTPQADIYSLGKVLYEAATGRDRQEFPELPTRLLGTPPQEKEFFELNEILLKACSPLPADRYKTAGDLLAELQLIHGGGSIRGQRARKRRVRLFLWNAAAALCVTGLVAAWAKLLDLRVRSIQGESTSIPRALAGKVPPRDPSAPDSTVDLSRYYTAPLNEPWYPGPNENTLTSLPQGLRKFAETSFDVRGLLQLSGREIRDIAQSNQYPAEIHGIGIHQWVKRLEFLQGAVSEAPDGIAIGRYELEFASGRTLEIPLLYGRDLRALWQPADSDGTVTNAVVAWSGNNPATRERQLYLRLYKKAWENPWPQDKVVQLSFFSHMKNSAPFLVALSSEPLAAPPQATSPVDIVAGLQKWHDSFPLLQPATNASGSLSFLKFNHDSIQVGGIYFKGFRFTAPLEHGMDFLWAFASSTNTHSYTWGIFPLNGRMKAGFEDWYHGSFDGHSDGFPLQVQCLSGKKLNPGAEYVIAFALDQEGMDDVQLSMRFVPAAEINPNKPETMLQSLHLQTLPEFQGMKFHRHYCMGWWK